MLDFLPLILPVGLVVSFILVAVLDIIETNKKEDK
jgi:hypothetical protein